MRSGSRAFVVAATLLIGAGVGGPLDLARASTTPTSVPSTFVASMPQLDGGTAGVAVMPAGGGQAVTAITADGVVELTRWTVAGDGLTEVAGSSVRVATGCSTWSTPVAAGDGTGAVAIGWRDGSTVSAVVVDAAGTVGPARHVTIDGAPTYFEVRSIALRNGVVALAATVDLAAPESSRRDYQAFVARWGAGSSTASKRTIRIGASGTDVLDAAIDASGRVVIVGADRSSVKTRNDDFAVARLTTNLDPDPTFDGDGRVLTHIGTPTDVAHAVTLDEQGRIVVAGRGTTRSGFAVAMARYLPSGALDVTFSGDGKHIAALSASDIAEDVAVAGGRIIVSATSTSTTSDRHISVGAFTTQGSLDAAFGNKGVIAALGPGDDQAAAVAVVGVVPVAVGTSFTPDDANQHAVAVTAIGGAAVVDDIGTGRFHRPLDVDDAITASDGRIVAVGSTPGVDITSPIVVMADPAGGTPVVETVGVSGTRSYGTGVVERPGGGYFMTASAGVDSSPDIALVRLDGNGNLVGRTEVNGGVAGKPTTLTNDWPMAVAIDSQGRAVVAGRANNTTLVLRFTAVGALDASFGVGGRVLLSSFSGMAFDAAVDGADRILVTGESVNGGDTNAFVARLLPSGALDPAFGIKQFGNSTRYERGQAIVHARSQTAVALASGGALGALVLGDDGSVVLQQELDPSAGWDEPYDVVPTATDFVVVGEEPASAGARQIVAWNVTSTSVTEPVQTVTSASHPCARAGPAVVVDGEVTVIADAGSRLLGLPVRFDPPAPAA